MQVGDGEIGDPRDGLLEVDLGLSGEAANDIRADTAIGNCGADVAEESFELRSPVITVHACQYRIATALERDMEMAGEFVFGGHEPDDLFADGAGSDGAEAKTRQAGYGEDAMNEIGKGLFLIEIGAVIPEMNTGQHDLPITVVHQSRDLFDDFSRLPTAGTPASLGNDAKAACAIASILDLHDGAAAIHHACNGDLREGARRGNGRDGDFSSAVPARFPVAWAGRQALFDLGDDADSIGNPKHQNDSGQLRDLVRRPLRIAAGNDDPGRRLLAPNASDCLAGRGIGLGGHATGIYYVHIRRLTHGNGAKTTAFLQESAYGFGVVLVDATPEGAEGDTV